MTPNTQCELCKAGIARNGKAHFRDGEFIGWCKTLCEPVAEPASTGEPPPKQMPHIAFEVAQKVIDAVYASPEGQVLSIVAAYLETYATDWRSARPSGPSAPETSAEDEALPREAAPILAALFNSLIEQNCPDSVSGYTMFDAMWPKIQAFAAPQPVFGDAHKSPDSHLGAVRD